MANAQDCPKYDPKEKEKHVCAGLNTCAGLGKDGTGTMPGNGSCATAEHVCHTHNCCRGQGGCGYEGTAIEQAYPGVQECRTWGSCATPINECRISTLGEFKGRSTWEVARMRFEDKMKLAGIAIGPSPSEGSSDTYVPSYVNQGGGLCGTLAEAKQEAQFRVALREKKNPGRMHP
jgi:hypothetical protein